MLELKVLNLIELIIIYYNGCSLELLTKLQLPQVKKYTEIPVAIFLSSTEITWLCYRMGCLSTDELVPDEEIQKQRNHWQNYYTNHHSAARNDTSKNTL